MALKKCFNHFALLIRFQVFPFCVIVSDMKNKELTGQITVRVGFRVWGGTLSKGHYQ